MENENPKEGLVSIDKVCEWLNKTLYIHTEENEDKDWNEVNPINWVTSDYDTVEEFIENFCKAMEKYEKRN